MSDMYWEVDDNHKQLTVNELFASRKEAWENYLKTGYEMFSIIAEIQTKRLEQIGYKLPKLMGVINIDPEVQKEYEYLNVEDKDLLESEEDLDDNELDNFIKEVDKEITELLDE